MSKRVSRDEWLKRVRARKASGASRAAFASDKPYSERSLGWWSWKLASEGEQVETTPKPKAAQKKRKPATDRLFPLHREAV